MGNAIKTIMRIVGWAGSGKTTRLLNGISKALSKLGNDPLSVGFSSFTRAARSEAATRAANAWGCEAKTLEADGWFRTIHSVAHRCLGISSDELIKGTRDDTEWLSNAVSCRVHTVIDPSTGQTSYKANDETGSAGIALDLWSLARSTMRPYYEIVKEHNQYAKYPIPVSNSIGRIEAYESAKRLDGRLDFTDMVSRFAGISHDPKEGSSRCEPEGYVPETPLLVIDEFQDTSLLLYEAFKRWASDDAVRKVVLAGDPGQTIHQWNGATPDCLMNWEVDTEEMMGKTWRCPENIVELGQKALGCIKGSTFDYTRKIEPSKKGGHITTLDGLEQGIKYIRAEEDWLVLARTGYQAGLIQEMLAKFDIPFRSTITTGKIPAKVVGMKALLSLEKGRPVTGHQFAQAIAILPSKDRNGDSIVRHGFKKKWKAVEYIESWEVVFPKQMREAGIDDRGAGYIHGGRWQLLVDGGVDWRTKVDKHGVDIAQQPKVRVGTIHSAKGMEADNVFVLGTTNELIERMANNDNQRHNEEARLAYVAVTRAKERLVVCREGRTHMRGLPV